MYNYSVPLEALNLPHRNSKMLKTLGFMGIGTQFALIWQLVRIVRI